MVRVFASLQCVPSSLPARCHMWVAFVVGSRFASRNVLRAIQFSLLHKKKQHLHKENNISKFQLDQNRRPA